jgi:hypothetical protein
MRSRHSTLIPRLTALALLFAAATYSHAAQIQFHGKFDWQTTLQTPQDCTPSNSPYLCWQRITGLDLTNYTWPPQLWGSQSAYGGGAVFQLISNIPGASASTIGDYLSNRILNVEDHAGNATNKALYSEIKAGPGGQNPIGGGSLQNTFQIFPTSATQGDLYVAYRLRFQPGMIANMTGLNTSYGGIYGNGGTWRSFFELKTGALATAGEFPGDNGDYRFAAYVVTGCPATLIAANVAPCNVPNPNPAPFWYFAGDNVAGGGYPLTNGWYAANTAVAIPDDGSWNWVQVFVRRSAPGVTGRFWLAINGTTLVDHYGPNTGSAGLPINRIMPLVLYTGGRLPAYQWVDDIEIWNGMP